MSVSMDRPIAKSKWRSPPVLIGAGVIGALVLAILIAMAVKGSSVRTLRVPMTNVTIEPVSQGVFHDFTPLQGKITPRDTIYLDALQGGQVQEVLVQAGDRVVKGQPLIKFPNHAVELDVLEREATVSQALSQTQQIREHPGNHARRQRTGRCRRSTPTSSA